MFLVQVDESIDYGTSTPLTGKTNSNYFDEFIFKLSLLYFNAISLDGSFMVNGKLTPFNCKTGSS
jgi:hypothetical protein